MTRETAERKRPQHWAVSVAIDGENVLTIESNMLSGDQDLERHTDTVRMCGEILLAFIGPENPEPFIVPDDEAALLSARADGERDMRERAAKWHEDREQESIRQAREAERYRPVCQPSDNENRERRAKLLMQVAAWHRDNAAAIRAIPEGEG